MFYSAPLEAVFMQCRDAVVLFYASWCGFCKGIYHHFFAAAKFFRGFKGLLFARIDASKNDLPWQFTVERYPTVVFFSSNKADSVQYSGLITTVRLVRFVLRHLRHEVAWQLAGTLCDSRLCLLRNLRKLQAWRRHYSRLRLFPAKLAEAHRRERTLRHVLLDRLWKLQQISQDYHSCELKGRFSGLGCRTNSTVRFVALDGRHSEFAPPKLLADRMPTAVLYATKDAVVLFYASWCGFCKGIYHHFFAAAKFFRGFKGLLFARIDASKNDLPWQFTVERYPTVVFFSSNKADSVQYSGLITTVRLVRFVLRHLRHEVAWQLAGTLCDSRLCLLRNLRKLQAWRRHYSRLRLFPTKLAEAHRRERTLRHVLLDRLWKVTS
ncbi:hypothetical protein HPB48_012206 [Haemaphysalis longicornis]|uniref:Thioredoxin domain-containing protein n=1 Tax=Haemaphysalis longicornis TaxID=44386 RepID=A0A9J6FUE2_HAELO|nr:hypothetical protein HPB48_012206 [Haemaphysalis longicornis]